MIRIENLSKSFRMKKVLHNVSLDLDQGVYGLLGPNGSGKTTLLRCITGIYPEAGKHIQLTIPDKRKTKTSPIGYLPQAFGLFEQLTAIEALSLLAQLKGVQRADVLEQVMSAIKAVNLEDRAHDPVGKLSGGMIRRLGIAQTLIGNPPIKIYDEPTAGLDPEERLRFKRVIQTAPPSDVTIISTHIVEDIEATCDKVIILSLGKVLFVGTQGELAAKAKGHVFLMSQDDYTDFLEPDGTFVIQSKGEKKQQVRVLSTIALPNASTVEPTLEDGYMALIKGIV